MDERQPSSIITQTHTCTHFSGCFGLVVLGCHPVEGTISHPKNYPEGQERAIKMIKRLENLPNKERLKHWKVFSVGGKKRERVNEEDTTEGHKIVPGVEKVEILFSFHH